MSDETIPTPESPGPMDTDTAADFIFAPPEAEPTEETEADAAPDAEEADEAAPDESPDEPEGDPDQDEVDEESDPADTEDYVVVKVNGEEREVSLEEAISGYSRTEDYKAKTRELAESRKAWEAEKAAEQQQLAEQRAKYAARLNDEPAEPDWDTLRAEDPIGYAEQFADWQRAKSAREAERAAFQKEEQERINAFQRQTGLKAIETFPEWTETGKYAEGAEARAKAAAVLGFTEGELAANHDYRVFAMLEKAARYDALMAEKSQAKAKVLKKVKKAPAKMKPDARRPRRDAAEAEQARLSKLKRSGSVDDAVALIFNE